uniref:Uncharacterized protein n=1 Tax=Plectus sambesii TaxID=2011161 RepID=A0A914X6Y0_9BILA
MRGDVAAPLVARRRATGCSLAHVFPSVGGALLLALCLVLIAMADRRNVESTNGGGIFAAVIQTLLNAGRFFVLIAFRIESSRFRFVVIIGVTTLDRLHAAV